MQANEMNTTKREAPAPSEALRDAIRRAEDTLAEFKADVAAGLELASACDVLREVVMAERTLRRLAALERDLTPYPATRWPAIFARHADDIRTDLLNRRVGAANSTSPFQNAINDAHGEADSRILHHHLPAIGRELDAAAAGQEGEHAT